MRFSLIDHIVVLEPGVRIEAVKALSLAEEYLADHFPRAPVLPGVLMLEALNQAAAWLVRASENFAHSAVLLSEVRGVRYANFVEPGQVMQIKVDIVDQDERHTRVKGQAAVDGVTCIAARLTLERFSLGDSDPGQSQVDAYMIEQARALFAILYPARPVALAEKT